MNNLFIYLVVPLTVVPFNSMFQSKLNQPLLLKQFYSINLLGIMHFLLAKVTNSILNNSKSSRNQFIATNLPHNG